MARRTFNNHDDDDKAPAPPSRNVIGKQFNSWAILAHPDLLKALSAAVVGYDGTPDAFEAFRVNLEFYLDSVDFILKQARTVYNTLSFTEKDQVVEARSTFKETYGLMGLKGSHHDCLRIFEFIFTKFPHTKCLVRMDHIIAANKTTDTHDASTIWNSIMIRATTSQQ